MIGKTVRGFALWILAVPGFAFAGDPCGTPGPADRLAGLAADAGAADPSSWTRKERRLLESARAVLDARKPGLLAGCEGLATAARRLEPIAAADFASGLSEAFHALRDDLAAERISLERNLSRMPLEQVAAFRSTSERLDAKAAALALMGRFAAAAAVLFKAARAADEIRHPRVPIYGGPLRVVGISTGSLGTIRLNEPVVIQFSDRVDPSTIRADTIQIREAPNFGLQAPGTFVVRGPLVTFLPRLPTKSDLSDAGFRPGRKYQVRIGGPGATSVVREKGGDPVARTFESEFSAVPGPADLFSPEHYADDPPPGVACTTPTDVLPSAPWDDPGGAKEVPADGPIVLTFRRVPLLPATVGPSDVTLTMTEFHGLPVLRRIPGTPVLVQDSDSVRLEFVPLLPLPDRSRFVLRLSSRVADLSGLFELPTHAGRAALRSAALADPTGPLAALFLRHPLELDPRTFLVFTTRDEPAQDMEVALEFDGSDRDIDGRDGNDAAGTSASFNGVVPGSVAAIVTAASGDGSLLDFHPTVDIVLDTSSPLAPGGVFQFRTITIPRGVTVTVRGPVPAILRCQGDALVEGVLFAGGSMGMMGEVSMSSASLPMAVGGGAGPGGGAGGDSSTAEDYGLPGGSGASVPGGGQGGGGGYETASTSTWSFAGGGGGGGHAVPGQTGYGGTYSSASHPFNGAGGAPGGQGGDEPRSSATDGGRYFRSMGGAGGGAGGNNHYTPWGVRTSGAGGGGGGGAILLTAGGNIRISGTIDASGGRGGSYGPGGTYYGGAPGGGGAGGAIALYTEKAIDLTGAVLHAQGGAAGSMYMAFYVGAGGQGAPGFVRAEDGDGSIAGLGSAAAVPGATTGAYRPVSSSADLPSTFRSSWFALAAVRPEIRPFTEEDLVGTEVPGCTVRWELQAAVDDPFNPGRPDTSVLDPATGASTDPVRATGWLLLRDSAGGIRDLSADLDGRGYEYFRIRATFTLGDGLGPDDAKPALDRFRIRFRTRQ